MPRRSWQRLLEDVRQRRFPVEFRIDGIEWPAGFSEAVLSSDTSPADPPAPELPSAAAAEENARLLADVGTGLWRLRKRMVDQDTGRPLDPMRKAYRHFESVWDTLTQAGVEIRDHTGELVPEGGVYALKTIAFQPTPGLRREKVIETIKPSVCYRNQPIQMGEVIVGTPADAENQGKTS
jgi:hypothetical protein